VCAQLHFNICKETGTTGQKTLIRTCPKINRNRLWNQQVQNDRTIPNNKPDIIIRENEKRTCMLIDVAISGDRNVIKKRSQENSKI
jgi:hypothetical protein